MPAANHWKLGLFVASSLGLGAIGLIWLGGAMIGRSSVERVTYFDESVQGLELGSPVKFRGVPIGTVSGIGIAPDQRHVEVRAQIFDDALERMGLGAGETSAEDPWLDAARRPPEVRVQLASAGITGVKFLEVDFFDPEKVPPPVLPFPVPPNYFPSHPSTLKTLEAALADLTEELPNMLMRAGETLEMTGHTLDAVRMALEPLVASDGPVVGALQEFRATAAVLREGVQAADLGATSAAARRASDAVAQAASSIGAAAGSIGTAADSVGGLTVDAGELAEDLHTSLEQLGQSLDSFRALVDYLERNPAALLRGRGELVPDERIALALLAALLGCLPDVMVAEPRYFAPVEPAVPSADRVALSGAAPLLRLRRVQAAAHLRERIVWRRSATEFGFHELSRWTQPPAAFAEQWLSRELFERRGLRRALAGAHPLLQVNLLAFDEVLEPEHAARVELTARLSDPGGAALLERTYAAERRVEGRAPADLAHAMGAALAEVIAQLGGDAADALSSL